MLGLDERSDELETFRETDGARKWLLENNVKEYFLHVQPSKYPCASQHQSRCFCRKHSSRPFRKRRTRVREMRFRMHNSIALLCLLVEQKSQPIYPRTLNLQFGLINMASKLKKRKQSTKKEIKSNKIEKKVKNTKQSTNKPWYDPLSLSILDPFLYFYCSLSLSLSLSLYISPSSLSLSLFLHISLSLYLLHFHLTFIYHLLISLHFFTPPFTLLFFFFPLFFPYFSATFRFTFLCLPISLIFLHLHSFHLPTSQIYFHDFDILFSGFLFSSNFLSFFPPPFFTQFYLCDY